MGSSRPGERYLKTLECDCCFFTEVLIDSLRLNVRYSRSNVRIGFVGTRAAVDEAFDNKVVSTLSKTDSTVELRTCVIMCVSK